MNAPSQDGRIKYRENRVPMRQEMKNLVPPCFLKADSRRWSRLETVLRDGGS